MCWGQLPARCDKRWYLKTFCGVDDEEYEAKFAPKESCGILDGFRMANHLIIAQHLHGSIKAYCFGAFALNLRAFNLHKAHFVSAEAARTVVAGDSGSISHNLFLTADVALSSEMVVTMMKQLYLCIDRLCVLNWPFDTHTDQPESCIHLILRILSPS